jgi:hypothetical protein
MSALIDQGVLAGGDGTFDLGGSGRDRLSSPGWDYDYQLTDAGGSQSRACGGALGLRMEGLIVPSPSTPGKPVSS